VGYYTIKIKYNVKKASWLVFWEASFAPQRPFCLSPSGSCNKKGRSEPPSKDNSAPLHYSFYAQLIEGFFSFLLKGHLTSDKLWMQNVLEICWSGWRDEGAGGGWVVNCAGNYTGMRDEDSRGADIKGTERKAFSDSSFSLEMSSDNAFNSKSGAWCGTLNKHHFYSTTGASYTSPTRYSTTPNLFYLLKRELLHSVY